MRLLVAMIFTLVLLAAAATPAHAQSTSGVSPAGANDWSCIGHDPIALRWIQNALARTGPADPAFDPGCSVSAR